MESIIQKDRECCFLCGMNANLEPLDEHHVYFGPYRKKSEKYGLKVYLHHNKCHIFGVRSVHQNAKVDKAIKRVVQKRAMKHYGWTIEQFREIFGKNYID
jgi:hypothetical protein